MPNSPSFFSKLYKTFRSWLEKKHSKPYETRIRSYMEKHPSATLAEARGHKEKVKKRKVRVTIGTSVYPVGKSQIARYTLSKIVDGELVTETKVMLLEEMYREIERDVNYKRSDWWFEVETGFEVIEVEGD